MITDAIFKILFFLKDKVDNYNESTSSVVEIVNIATLNDGDEFLDSTSPIVLSIINIEEDTTARNPNVYIPQTNPPQKYNNPSQHLVLSILFTAYNKEQKKEKYEDGIKKLEHVMHCFQEERVFFIDVGTMVNPNVVKVILDMESLKISELNQLWSMLGNKYMPSVLYKMRLISVQHTQGEEGAVIESLKIKLWENNPEDLAGLIEETEEINLNNP